MPFLILAILFAAVLYGPQLWVNWVLRRHGRERPDLPGTGGEFARHLLDRLGLHEVQVETTEEGDHYDPRSRRVRLLPQHHDGRSLTAVVIAAHEVGHALQHAQGYAPLLARQRLVELAGHAQRIGSGILIAAPFLAVLARAPAPGLLVAAAGLLTMGAGALVHLVTLPVELDASFRRALPILEAGYLRGRDLKAAHSILRAAAMTYAAGALASLLNVWRWLRVGR